MKNFLKGFIIGIAKIIPGISGSMLAISMGVYEKLLFTIANITKINYTSFWFLSTISIGILSSICLFSYSIKYLLTIFYFPIMLLFTGMIIGGTKNFVKELPTNSVNIKNILFFISAFILSLNLTTFCNNIIASSKEIDISILGLNLNFLTYYGLGITEAVSSIIPGISGTAIFMALGCYDMILDFYSNIFNLSNFKFSIAFSLGILTGAISLAKIITYLLKKHKIITYFSILGFIVSSLILMLIETFTPKFYSSQIPLGIFSFILGYLISNKINTLFANK